MDTTTLIIITALTAIIVGGVIQYMIFRYGLKTKYNRILEEAMAHCKQLLKDNMDILNRVAEALLEKETLDGEEFLAAFRGHNATDGEAAAESEETAE